MKHISYCLILSAWLPYAWASTQEHPKELPKNDLITVLAQIDTYQQALTHHLDNASPNSAHYHRSLTEPIEENLANLELLKTAKKDEITMLITTLHQLRSSCENSVNPKKETLEAVIRERSLIDCKKIWSNKQLSATEKKEIDGFNELREKDELALVAIAPNIKKGDWLTPGDELFVKHKKSLAEKYDTLFDLMLTVGERRTLQDKLMQRMLAESEPKS